MMYVFINIFTLHIHTNIRVYVYTCVHIHNVVHINVHY